MHSTEDMKPYLTWTAKNSQTKNRYVFTHEKKKKFGRGGYGTLPTHSWTLLITTLLESQVL